MDYIFGDSPEKFPHRTPAKRGSERTVRDSDQRQALAVNRVWPAACWDSVRRGLDPWEMEVKWAIFAEDFWVHYHRSWTGFGIFSARFEMCNDELRIVEAWASRNKDQYGGKGGDEKEEVETLCRLTDWIAGAKGRAGDAISPNSGLFLPLHPEAQRLTAENAILLDELAALAAERHTLQHVVRPNLLALYQTKLGPWELRLLEARCDVTRLKRKVEMVQASLNRGQKPDLDAIDAHLELEFITWQQEMKGAAQKIEAAQFRLEHQLTTEQDAELKKLYHALVKKLHPDVNPDLTEDQKRLWAQVLAAYEAGNLDELKALTLLADHGAKAPSAPDSIEKLRAEHERLIASVKAMLAQLEEIKVQPPFNMQAHLQDEAWVTARRAEIDSSVTALHEQAATLANHLQALLIVHAPGQRFGPN